MYHRRILSLWFPHLAAEHALRSDPTALDGPFAIIREQHNSPANPLGLGGGRSPGNHGWSILV